MRVESGNHEGCLASIEMSVSHDLRRKRKARTARFNAQVSRLSSQRSDSEGPQRPMAGTALPERGRTSHQMTNRADPTCRRMKGHEGPPSGQQDDLTVMLVAPDP